MKPFLIMVLGIILLGCKGNETTIQNVEKVVHESTIDTRVDSTITVIPEEKKDSVFITVNMERFKNLGFIDKYDTLPKLKWEEVEACNYHSTDTSIFQHIPRSQDSMVSVEVADAIYTFQQSPIFMDNGDQGYEILGFYPELKCYALAKNAVGENLNFSTFCLADSLTGELYEIASIQDWRVENPVPSVKNTYMAYYQNYSYQNNKAFIGILRVVESDDGRYLTEYSSYHSENWKIEELTWENDFTLTVKAFQEVREGGKWSKRYMFYQSELP